MIKRKAINNVPAKLKCSGPSEHHPQVFVQVVNKLPLMEYSRQFNYNNGSFNESITHRRFRGIEWNGVKIYDLQKVTFSTLFKLYIAGLGVLIPKRYHMWV